MKNSQLLCDLARRLMLHPAAPYHEHAVRQEVEAIGADYGLEVSRDGFGNLLIRLCTAANFRPLVLAAHLDHPGFEIIHPLSDQRWLARFCGGVPEAYFRPGTAVRLMPGATPAILGQPQGKDRTFAVIGTLAPTVSPRFAVWDLEDFALRRERLYGRACDDLIGVAAALATLIELKRSRARVHVIGALSRAEEVGFHGALALAAAKGLPENALILSLETSKELPGGKMGQGVILRVGDRASIFDSAASRFLAEVAAELVARDKTFPFQRALMSGGTCEATPYQEFGFQTAAVCVALGNYHNCGPQDRIQAEYVSVTDVVSMVDLLVAAARQMPRYGRLTGRLPKRLRDLLRQAQPKLQRTAGNPDSNG